MGRQLEYLEIENLNPGVSIEYIWSKLGPTFPTVEYTAITVHGQHKVTVM